MGLTGKIRATERLAAVRFAYGAIRRLLCGWEAANNAVGSVISERFEAMNRTRSGDYDAAAKRIKIAQAAVSKAESRLATARIDLETARKDGNRVGSAFITEARTLLQAGSDKLLGDPNLMRLLGQIVTKLKV